MNVDSPSATENRPRPKPVQALAQRFWLLSRSILRHANRGVPRVEFMREMSRLVLEFSQCDGIEVRLWGPEKTLRWQAWQDGRSELEMLPSPGTAESACRFPRHPVLERICRTVVGHTVCRLPSFTPNGSFWTADTRVPTPLAPGEKPVALGVADETRSLCLIGFVIDEVNAGVVLLESPEPGRFHKEEIEHYEGMAQTLGLAIADRRAQAALRERMKELTCLYGIARLIGDGKRSAGLLPGVAEELRTAFQYPESAAVRITLDADDIRTDNWREGGPTLETEVTAFGNRRGRIAVNYPAGGQDVEPDPFLPEEKELLEAAARELALSVERREAESEKARLQEQLRHADRLATIGQLAAGIAHELNEPLANVLGFAQLLNKDGSLPAQARADSGRIEEAALHAREVIRKLMLFARQAPPRTSPVDLNELVREGLYFLEGRCAKNDIQLNLDLASDLPEFTADSSQLLQVLINLVVNSIQAMPHGGRITVSTRAEPGRVLLAVEDTGIGMSNDVMRQVFLPFFTTKDVNEGTGLGLAVVHGIVTGHRGSITVESEVGVGSRFVVRLPREADMTAEEATNGNPPD